MLPARTSPMPWEPSLRGSNQPRNKSWISIRQHLSLSRKSLPNRGSTWYRAHSFSHRPFSTFEPLLLKLSSLLLTCIMIELPFTGVVNPFDFLPGSVAQVRCLFLSLRHSSCFLASPHRVFLSLSTSASQSRWKPRQGSWTVQRS